MLIKLEGETEEAIFNMAYHGGKRNKEKAGLAIEMREIAECAELSEKLFDTSEDDPEFEGILKRLNRLNYAFELGYAAGKLRLDVCP